MSSDEEEEKNAIVVDSGSHTFRAGFAGDDAPQCVFQSVVGRHKYEAVKDDVYVGDDAQQKRELLSLTYPIDRGIVVNWDDMEKIFDHAFYSELKIFPEEHPILFSEPPLNPRSHREKMAQILFESYDFPSLFIGYKPLFSVYAHGLHHGLVISVGDGVTYVVPVYESRVLFQGVRRLDFAGKDITQHLQQLLHKRGHSFTTSEEFEIVKEIKEKHCFIPESQYVKYNTPCKDVPITLADGSNIVLDAECLHSPDILFSPNNDSIPGQCLTTAIYQSINACDMLARTEMCCMMTLNGASTLTPGFSDRLQNELRLCFPRRRLMKIWASPTRKYTDWIGGSVEASLSTFQPLWISRKEYDEIGPNIVSRKCFN